MNLLNYWPINTIIIYESCRHSHAVKTRDLMEHICSDDCSTLLKNIPLHQGTDWLNEYVYVSKLNFDKLANNKFIYFINTLFYK